jgi:hypothetical protein
MMPNMASTITGFEDTMQFTIVVKETVDHELDESSKTPVILWFEGNVQPMSPRKLMIKPEGQRKFKWWELFTDLEMAVDTIIKDRNGLQYRVMASSDWSQAGFYQYQLIEGVGLL